MSRNSAAKAIRDSEESATQTRDGLRVFLDQKEKGKCWK
jgi:hypothetical protein